MKIPHQFNQHHTTYCQEEPFVETRKLFFARADFRDVDLRGACSVWNILRIGGYWIHLQVFEGRAHEAKDPWLQANQAIQDTRIIATFITFWLCRPPLLVEPAPSLGMSEGLMSIPPSTDPTPSDPARTKNLLKTKNQNPSRTRPGLCFLGYRCGRWMEVTGFSKVSKVPKSNLFLQNFRVGNDLLPWRRNSGEETVHFRFGFEMLASKTALWMQLELCQLRFPGIQLMNWW